MFAVETFDHRPGCTDRLDLVDAAFISPGEADELKALCARCPIAIECLTEAMREHQHGVWGGTSPSLRTRHGAQAARPGKGR